MIQGSFFVVAVRCITLPNEYNTINPPLIF